MSQPAINTTEIHHIGIPVSDLATSRNWYARVLGATDLGIRGKGSGQTISDALKVPGADLEVVFIRIGACYRLELLEYKSPKRSPHHLSNSDIGAMHICFQVDDIEDSYRRLREAGVTLHHRPVKLDADAGDLAGYSFLYFSDPDGITLELFQVPAADR